MSCLALVTASGRGRAATLPTAVDDVSPTSSVPPPSADSRRRRHGRCSWRCLAMLIAFAWLTWYPFWVLLVVAVSVAVISALTARGRDAATPVQLSGSHAGRVVLTGVAGG